MYHIFLKLQNFAHFSTFQTAAAAEIFIFISLGFGFDDAFDWHFSYTIFPALHTLFI